MDFLTINLPFLVVVFYLIIMLIVSAKRGFAKELCSLVAIVIATIAVMLIAFALRAYFNQERIIFVITIILLFLLFVLYKIIDLALVSIKIISKLPLIRRVDKLLGIFVGIVEVLFTVWAVYCIVIVFDAGAFEKWVMDCVHNNALMKLLYEYNYMYIWTEKINDAVVGFDIFGKLGM